MKCFPHWSRLSQTENGLTSRLNARAIWNCLLSRQCIFHEVKTKLAAVFFTIHYDILFSEFQLESACFYLASELLPIRRHCRLSEVSYNSTGIYIQETRAIFTLARQRYLQILTVTWEICFPVYFTSLSVHLLFVAADFNMKCILFANYVITVS